MEPLPDWAMSPTTIQQRKISLNERLKEQEKEVRDLQSQLEKLGWENLQKQTCCGGYKNYVEDVNIKASRIYDDHLKTWAESNDASSSSGEDCLEFVKDPSEDLVEETLQRFQQLCKVIDKDFESRRKLRSGSGPSTARMVVSELSKIKKNAAKVMDIAKEQEKRLKEESVKEVPHEVTNVVMGRRLKTPRQLNVQEKYKEAGTRKRKYVYRRGEVIYVKTRRKKPKTTSLLSQKQLVDEPVPYRSLAELKTEAHLMEIEQPEEDSFLSIPVPDPSPGSSSSMSLNSRNDSYIHTPDLKIPCQNDSNNVTSRPQHNIPSAIPISKPITRAKLVSQTNAAAGRRSSTTTSSSTDSFILSTIGVPAAALSNVDVNLTSNIKSPDTSQIPKTSPSNPNGDATPASIKRPDISRKFQIKIKSTSIPPLPSANTSLSSPTSHSPNLNGPLGAPSTTPKGIRKQTPGRGPPLQRSFSVSSTQSQSFMEIDDDFFTDV